MTIRSYLAWTWLVLAVGCQTVTLDPDADLEPASLPQQRTTCSGGRFRCTALVHLDDTDRIRPAAVPSGLGATDLAAAYKLDPTRATVATVAVVIAYAYPNADSDLAVYRSAFGLPPCTVANGCLIIDKSQNPGLAPSGDDWTVEGAIDLDMVSAGCPTCRIKLVLAADDIGAGLFLAQNTAAQGTVSISNSWGGPIDGNVAAEDAQYFTHPSVNSFAAVDGDSYPSTSRKVIAVGATTLTKASNARGWTEAAFSAGGCSSAFAKPSYQVGLAMTCTKRATADVAAVGGVTPGLAAYNAGAGGWIVAAGTSASTPFVAAVFARYGIASTGDASYAYTHTTQFFDVTTGAQAAVGWDGPTGIGTPNGAALGGGDQFTIAASPTTQLVVVPSPGTATYTVSTTVTAGSAQAIALSTSGLPAGVTATFTPTSVTAGASASLRLGGITAAMPSPSTFSIIGTGTTATHTVTAAFTTNQAPTVAITTPTSGAVVHGTVTVSATAADADGTIASVVLMFPDGSQQKLTAAPYTATWDSATVADGNVQIQAVATDNRGTTTTTAVAVAVDNCIQATFTQSPNLQMAANSLVQVPLVVTSTERKNPERIAELTITMNATHIAGETLIVSLRSPGPTTQTVLAGLPASSPAILNITQKMADFVGTSPAAGTWTLIIQNDALHGSTLSDWSLAIKGDCSAAVR